METDLVHCEVQTAVNGVRSRASPGEILVGPTGTVTDFSHNISVLRCQYHSTNTPHPSSSQYSSLSERQEGEDVETSNKAALFQISQEHCKGKYFHIAFIL